MAAVQPHVPQAQKFDPALAADHMRALQRFVGDGGRRGADLIVLPETALPLNLFGPGGALVEVGRWAHQARATIIASSLENGASNIAVAVAPSGTAVSRYDKVRLVAFGETGILPGTRYEPLWTPVGRVGVAICFESIFPDVTRELVRNGGQVLAVMTNDAWFDGTAGPAQHAVHAVLRAVESGRWVVRAANTGLSMVIDPAGRVRATLSPRQSGVLISRTGLVDAPTFYASRGDVLVGAGLGALLVAAAPDLRRALAHHWRRPAFQSVLSAVGLPWFAAMILLRARAPWWGLPAVLSGFLGAAMLFQPARGLGPHMRGHRPRGHGAPILSALVGGSVAVVALESDGSRLPRVGHDAARSATSRWVAGCRRAPAVRGRRDRVLASRQRICASSRMAGARCRRRHHHNAGNVAAGRIATGSLCVGDRHRRVVRSDPRKNRRLRRARDPPCDRQYPLLGHRRSALGACGAAPLASAMIGCDDTRRDQIDDRLGPHAPRRDPEASLTFPRKRHASPGSRTRCSAPIYGAIPTRPRNSVKS